LSGLIHAFLLQIERPLLAYYVEEVKQQQLREVSELQPVGDCSTAAVLASLGWQNFYLNVNVPAFFNTIAPKRTISIWPM
jgi:hypothetical protein